MRKLSLITLTLLSSIAICINADAQTRKERKAIWGSPNTYEVKPLGVGQDGTKVFQVWATGKKKDDAIFKAMIGGVSVCIFKGLPGGAGSAPTPPIVSDPNAMEKHDDYFDQFFTAGGKYTQFIVETVPPTGSDVMNLGKKLGYKVGIRVQINYDALRKQLEHDGIARKLDAGF